jgi:hypothetical protein
MKGLGVVAARQNAWVSSYSLNCSSIASRFLSWLFSQSCLTLQLRWFMVEVDFFLGSSDGKQEQHESQWWGRNDSFHRCYRNSAAARRWHILWKHISKRHEWAWIQQSAQTAWRHESWHDFTNSVRYKVCSMSKSVSLEFLLLIGHVCFWRWQFSRI